MSSDLHEGNRTWTPVVDSRSSQYQNYAALHYSKMYSFDEAEYRRMARKYRWQYRSLLPKNKDAAILDVGCGVGHFLRMLQEDGYSNCSGVDLSPDQVEICRTRVNARVHLGDAMAYLAERPLSADWIVCMHLIEHLSLDQGRSFVRIVYDALRPGGRFVLATPNADSPWAGHCRFDDLTHVRLYTVRTLRELCESVGLRFVSAHPEGAAPYDFITAVRWGLASILHLVRKFTFAIEIGPGRAKGNDLILTPGFIAAFRKNENSSWADS